VIEQRNYDAAKRSDLFKFQTWRLKKNVSTLNSSFRTHYTAIGHETTLIPLGERLGCASTRRNFGGASRAGRLAAEVLCLSMASRHKGQARSSIKG